MKNFFLLNAILLLAVFGCKNSEKSDVSAQNANDFGASSGPKLKDKAVLEGNWIAHDFVNRVSTVGSVIGASRTEAAIPFCFAFTFLKGRTDSVYCFDHIKAWAAQIKFKEDTMEIVNAREGKSIFMVYDDNPEKSFMMYDNTSGSLVRHYYVQTREKLVTGYVAFNTALNHNLLGGGFRLLNSSNPKAIVSFSPPGTVVGLDDYRIFQICTGGDCWLAGDKMDAVYLSNPQKQKAQWFGFQFSGENDTLSFYRLATKTPKIRASWEIKELVYKMVRLPKQDLPTSPGPMVKPKKKE